MDLKQEIKDFFMKQHLATSILNISSTNISEVQVSWILFFTVSFMVENVMCKEKHFPPLTTRMELRLCDTEIRKLNSLQ